MRSLLISTKGGKFGTALRPPAVVTRKAGKENMPAHFYLSPRAAPTPPPTMSPFIQRAIQGIKEWDADIAVDSFWAGI